jgi:hypothetical protein
VPTLIAVRGSPGRPDLRLVLAGRDGWGAVAVRDAAAASGVTTRILRPGWFPGEEVFRSLRSRRRSPAVARGGLRAPALEAFACGAALVTTTGSAMAEVVGGAAVIVRADQVRSPP